MELQVDRWALMGRGRPRKPPVAAPAATDAGRYPLVVGWGTGPVAYLTKEQAIASTPDGRIRSIWPYLVRVAFLFWGTLRPTDAANYDPEDTLSELYVLLREKDRLWDPSRGSYLTFAARIVHNELHAVRDRAHTIHCPRNSSGRLKQYRAAEDALSGKRRQTYRDIRRAEGDRVGLGDTPADAADATGEATRSEDEARARRALAVAIGKLPTRAALALGLAHGLWGQAPLTVSQRARREGRTYESVRREVEAALQKLRQVLERGHLRPQPAEEDEEED